MVIQFEVQGCKDTEALGKNHDGFKIVKLSIKSDLRWIASLKAGAIK